MGDLCASKRRRPSRLRNSPCWLGSLYTHGCLTTAELGSSKDLQSFISILSWLQITLPMTALKAFFICYSKPFLLRPEADPAYESRDGGFFSEASPDLCTPSLVLLPRQTFAWLSVLLQIDICVILINVCSRPQSSSILPIINSMRAGTLFCLSIRTPYLTKYPAHGTLGDCLLNEWWKQAYLIFLCFALLHLAHTVFCINWRFVATWCQASLSVPLFQQHLFPLCLCVTFW